MRRVSWAGHGRLHLFEEPDSRTGVGCRAQLFYRNGDGDWSPPLPPDIELPAQPLGRSVNTTGVIVRDSKVPVTISGGPTRPRLARVQ